MASNDRKHVSVRLRLLVMTACALALAVITGLSVTAHAQNPGTGSETCPLIDYDFAAGLSPERADEYIAAQSKCLDRKNGIPSDERITDGIAVSSDNFRDVVRIEFQQGASPSLCTGVFIAYDTVLTAAHCGCGTNYSVQVQINDKAQFAGRRFISLTIDAGPITFAGFDCSRPLTKQIGKDLAIFRVSGSSRNSEDFVHSLGNTTKPFRLAVVRPAIRVLSDTKIGSLYMVGFGLTENGTVPELMRGAYVSIYSRFCSTGRVRNSVCAMYREFVLSRRSLSFGAPSTDSCGGDSGGPVYRIDSPFNPKEGRIVPSKKTLVGIVSRPLLGVVHPYPRLCGGGGVYTAVGTRPVLDWLDKNGVEYGFSYDLKEDEDEGSQSQ
jgi:hypothetical protein